MATRKKNDTGEIRELVIQVLVIDDTIDYKLEHKLESTDGFDVDVIGAVGGALVKRIQHAVKDGRAKMASDPRSKGQTSYLSDDE